MSRVKFPNIFLFGDSQTQDGCTDSNNWVSLISDHFKRRCDVLNRGFFGYNTRWCKMILPQLLHPEIVDSTRAVTIMLGSNDAALPDIDPQIHIPLEEYKTNLRDIITQFEESGVGREKIILITPPPVDEEKWSSTIKLKGDEKNSVFNEVLREYSAGCSQVAVTEGVTLIDLYTQSLEQKNWRKHVGMDGLHLAREGCQFLAELLIPELEKRVQIHQQVFPYYEDIDYLNPENSLIQS